MGRKLLSHKSGALVHFGYKSNFESQWQLHSNHVLGHGASGIVFMCAPTGAVCAAVALSDRQHTMYESQRVAARCGCNKHIS